MRQRRCEATANDSNSPKLHYREGYLTTVQIKPVIFYLFRCTFDELFFSCCDSVSAPGGGGLGTTISSLRRTTSGAVGNGLGRYRGLLIGPFTTSALNFPFCVCVPPSPTSSIALLRSGA
jgi:hypothetical protein